MSSREGQGGLIADPDRRVPGPPPPAPGASSPRRWRLRLDPGWLGGWAALIALAFWLSHLAPFWLLTAAAGTILWSIPRLHRRDLAGLGVALLLATATLVAAVMQVRTQGIGGSWPAVQHRIEERSAQALEEALDGLLASGERAVAGAAEIEPLLGIAVEESELFGRLQAVQRSTGVSALALYTPSGVARAWAGSHRGEVPAAARLGVGSYLFHEGPLFSHLYFVRPLPNGYTAVAAFLLDAELAAGADPLPFARRFERRYGVRPRFWHPERARAESIWDWATDRPILSVSFDALTQQHWRDRAIERGRTTTAITAFGALLLLSVLWIRERRRSPGVPIGLGTAALVIAPLDTIFGAGSLFTPERFVVPGRLGITLGGLLFLLTASSLWALVKRRKRRKRRMPLALSLLILIALYPLVFLLIERSATPELLADRVAGGVPLVLATALLLGRLLLALCRRLPPAGAAWLDRPGLRAVGFALPLLYGVALLLAPPLSVSPLLLAALWAIPSLLLLRAPAAPHEAPSTPELGLARWLTIGWLAGSAALAVLWPLHVRAELGRAEQQLSALGSPEDRALEARLEAFARHSAALARRGEVGVNLLYHSWVQSGLAESDAPARMGWWTGGAGPASELNLSELPPLAVAPHLAREAPDSVLLRHQAGVDGLHYLLLVPLEGGRHLSVEIPVRTRFGSTPPLGRFLDPARKAERSEEDALVLIPLEGGESTAAGTAIEWTRVKRGWETSPRLELPDGPVQAHLHVAGARLEIVLVRALLIEAAILGIFLLLWLLARAMAPDPAPLPILHRRWFRSFRGRLSLALFTFFLLPTLVFGAVAYGAVAREVARSATGLALRALDQASARLEIDALPRVGAEVQADLLRYDRGTLVAASAPELIDLGLFQTWLPPEVQLSFGRGFDLEEVELRDRPDAGYLIAYRRFDPQIALAAPIPLASNEITRRQTEFRDLLILATLGGLILSTFLALLVGRALVRPLDELRRAAATIGRGDLHTRLPANRADEFGSLFDSFNGMVEHLGRTRSALLQETRRTETIVAEAATGVLALDGTGRVELINPRAVEILGAALRTGDPVLADSGPANAFTEAIRHLWSSTSEEIGTELDHDGRSIRLRLRRLPDGSGGGGAVVALEDVTAEVRTARVLAWGEMARQVAHEIKNPLTPIKLAVQHLRRAFLDRRPDYEQILEGNVEVVLGEIDRLSAIARAFSRFGTPSTGSTPLEIVDLHRTIAEVVTLYDTTAAESRIEMRLPAEPLPPAIARTSELKEVLLNLLENAREATDHDGTITISATLAAGGELSVIVEDTGCGIDPDQLPQIFEPHFSTRSSGTGLGLAIVRRIVDSWGARIVVESEPGRGTRFRMDLPSAAGG